MVLNNIIEQILFVVHTKADCDQTPANGIFPCSMELEVYCMHQIQHLQDRFFPLGWVGHQHKHHNTLPYLQSTLPIHLIHIETGDRMNMQQGSFERHHLFSFEMPHTLQQRGYREYGFHQLHQPHVERRDRILGCSVFQLVLGCWLQVVGHILNRLEERIMCEVLF